MAFGEVEAGCRRESCPQALFSRLVRKFAAATSGSCRGTLRATWQPRARPLAVDPGAGSPACFGGRNPLRRL